MDNEENFEISTDPQVTSENPEERKAARALRIKRRQDALRKAEQPPEEQAQEEASLVDQATMRAAEELQELALDGMAKVTNVKVTCDEREVHRRKVCADKKQATLDILEEQAEEAQLQYEAVTKNWDAMLKLREPLEIQEAMNQQMIACNNLLKQKDKVIQQLKNDLKEMDDSYNIDLEKQDKDIKELSDRIENQVSVMQKAYEKQLSLIETAIGIERDALLDNNNKRWEMYYKLRDKEELQHIEDKIDQLEEHKQVMEAIMWTNHEKYREVKMELETLIQNLQRELEKLKATCLINTEKIGYNYQILKKREEENVFVKSQQKRKLNKMSDISNSLRAKIRKAAEDGAIEEKKADEEIEKLMEMMQDLEKKAYRFSRVNDYKFSQIWRMCMARCRDVSKQLRNAEVAIHAHVLAEPPPPPPAPPPKNPLLRIEKELKAKGNPRQSVAVVTKKAAGTEPFEHHNEDKERLIRHILQLISDNTGFLVEDRLFKLLEKKNPSSKNLCTLDAIFMALEIQDEADVQLLWQTFINYAFCPECVNLDSETENVDNADDASILTGHSRATTRGGGSQNKGRTSRSLSSGTKTVGIRVQDLGFEDQMLWTEAEEILEKCGDPQAPPPLIEASPPAEKRPGPRVQVGTNLNLSTHHPQSEPIQNPFLCHNGHPLEIEPMQVLTALGDFISVFVPPDKKKLYDVLDSVKPPDFSTASRILKSEEIENYWSQWENVFPREKQKFWNGLLTCLNKYLLILQEREKLHEEVCALRRRNAELRSLMRSALPRLPQLVFGEHGQFAAVDPDGDNISKLPPI